jgi:CRISPR-associated protein Cmr6
MVMPLYKDLREGNFDKNNDSHSGLWYERFFNGYDNQWSVKDKGKFGWVKNASKKCGSSFALELCRKRRLQLVNALSGDFQVFDTAWNFVSGLGLAHPVENGFAWHPTLGVPYLSGSAVKGLVRAWLEWVEGDEVDLWLGSEDEGLECAGKLIFFDAVPVEPVELVADVMTLHMGRWYERGGNIKNFGDVGKFPADWHDPNPVPFLAVKRASFLFAVAPRDSSGVDLVEPALVALGNALEWLGAGAKTGAGYGHLLPNGEKKLEFKEEEEKRVCELEDMKLSSEEKILRYLRREFDEARRRGDKKAGGSLSSDLASEIKMAILNKWNLEWREKLAVLAEEIYKFQGWGSKKVKQKRLNNIKRLRGI